MAKKQPTDQETVESLFDKLKDLTNKISGLVFTHSFGKKTQAWNFYIFSHKKKIENADLKTALLETIIFIEASSHKVDGVLKMKK